MSKHKQNMQHRPSTMGTGLGFGHESHSKLPAIQEQPMTPALATLIAGGQLAIGTRHFTLGQCYILVSEEPEGWHLSISHNQRLPTWDEIAKARYELLPLDKTFAMILPKPADFVNIHSNCFQIFEIPDEYAHH